MAELESLHQQCGYADYFEKYFVFPPTGHQPTTFFNYTTGTANLTDANPALTCDIFDVANNEALRINPCFDIYEIVSGRVSIPRAILNQRRALCVRYYGIFLIFLPN